MGGLRRNKTAEGSKKAKFAADIIPVGNNVKNNNLSRGVGEGLKIRPGPKNYHTYACVLYIRIIISNAAE